jgi:hypothetical protein
MKVFSNGFVYRLGERVKGCGERMAHTRFYGIRIFNWIVGPVIALGGKIKGAALNRPIRGRPE